MTISSRIRSVTMITATALILGLGAFAAAPAYAQTGALATVGGHTSQAPTTREIMIPDQVRDLASVNASKGNVIKPSVTAAGIPTYHVTSAGALAGIHACRSLGNDGTNQGVECADLWAEPDGNGGVFVFPQAEGFCNNGSNYPQCANVSIILNVDLGNGLHSTHDVGVCGHSNGNCVNGGRNTFNVLNTTLHGFELPGPGCGGTGTENEVWTVDWTGSDIELPVSAKNVASTSNLGSGHAIVCP